MDDAERAKKPGPRNANASLDSAMEKRGPFLKTEPHPSPRGDTGRRSKAVFLTFIGCCVALIWRLNNYLPTISWTEDGKLEAGFELVKCQAPAPSATAPNGVLEVFQVYQPVLTPSEAADETTFSNGTENSTTIASTESASSCEVVLMVHSFGYSYGMPFIGKWQIIPMMHVKLLTRSRKL